MFTKPGSFSVTKKNVKQRKGMGVYWISAMGGGVGGVCGVIPKRIFFPLKKIA